MVCKEVISGTMARVAEETYHDHCLTCHLAAVSCHARLLPGTQCKKRITGQLTKMECGLVCGACAAEIDREIQELRDMLAEGDETGAALAIGALKVRGLQPPEQSSDMGSCFQCQRKFKAGQQVYENPDTGKDLCHVAIRTNYNYTSSF